MTDKRSPLFTQGRNGRLAYLLEEGEGPTIVWLGGYASDMRGSKAEAVAGWAAAEGHAALRFDYTGHGESAGEFEAGTIGRWFEDALDAVDALTEGPLVLVGSSMGAWIAGLIAKARPERLAGLLLIAPAPDFTEELTRERWTEEERARLDREGRIAFPSEYDDGEMVYTKALFEDGARHLLLRDPLVLPCPVRILQGTRDDAVPWQHAVRVAEHITAEDLTLTLVKNGDHRLSTPRDMERMLGTLEELVRRGSA